MSEPMPPMNSEMNYKLRVEPAIHRILVQVGNDMTLFGIRHEEYFRAVWVWISNIIHESKDIPEWVMTELQAQAREESAGEG